MEGGPNRGRQGQTLHLRNGISLRGHSAVLTWLGCDIVDDGVGQFFALPSSTETESTRSTRSKEEVWMGFAEGPRHPKVLAPKNSRCGCMGNDARDEAWSTTVTGHSSTPRHYHTTSILARIVRIPESRSRSADAMPNTMNTTNT